MFALTLVSNRLVCYLKLQETIPPAAVITSPPAPAETPAPLVVRKTTNSTQICYDRVAQI